MDTFRSIMRRISYEFKKILWKQRSRDFESMRIHMLDKAFVFLKNKGLIDHYEKLDELKDKWSLYVERLFDPENPDSFYYEWKEDAGASNIIANIHDQYNRLHVRYALLKVLKDTDKTVLDFGCGTAALVLGYQNFFASGCRLILADVENMAKEFILFYAEQFSGKNIKVEGINLEKIPDNSADVLICLHVLEHLKNPSQVFAETEKKLKPGGFLIIEAPWGGHPEHLPEAPVDWENNGGSVLLNKNYKKEFHMDPYCALSSVYRKNLKNLYPQKCLTFK